MAKKPKYYSLKNILKENATYNMIIGKRSNGKTYAVLEHMLTEYFENGSEFAIIRRWEEDFRSKRGASMFSALVENGVLDRLTNGKFQTIVYYGSKWYPAVYDEKLDKYVRSDVPFAYAFALTQQEHDKSTAYPRVKNILFDEFITRDMYLPDEFITFMNTLSTIIRDRDDVTIFMLGNTINKYSPYFKEMNLTNVAFQRQGTIDVYTYINNPNLKVAVQYCAEGTDEHTRLASDKYFGFDNPKLNMITTGVWEIGTYPRLPHAYDRNEVIFRYYIMFEGETLQCEVIQHKQESYTFIHRWTSSIPNPDTDLVYTQNVDSRPNWRQFITKPLYPIEKKIAMYYKENKIFYSENEVGEIVRNYVKWCGTG